MTDHSNNTANRTLTEQHQHWTFKVREQDKPTRVYNGFNRRLQGARYIALVQFEGSTEVWALNPANPAAIDELMRYYGETYNQTVQLTTYTAVIQG